MLDDVSDELEVSLIDLRLMGVSSGSYGVASIADIICDRIPIPVWSGGTDEWPPAVSTEILTSKYPVEISGAKKSYTI